MIFAIHSPQKTDLVADDSVAFVDRENNAAYFAYIVSDHDRDQYLKRCYDGSLLNSSWIEIAKSNGGHGTDSKVVGPKIKLEPSRINRNAFLCLIPIIFFVKFEHS